MGGNSEILGGDSKKSEWGSVSKKVKNWVGIRGGETRKTSNLKVGLPREKERNTKTQ